TRHTALVGPCRFHDRLFNQTLERNDAGFHAQQEPATTAGSSQPYATPRLHQAPNASIDDRTTARTHWSSQPGGSKAIQLAPPPRTAPPSSAPTSSGDRRRPAIPIVDL